LALGPSDEQSPAGSQRPLACAAGRADPSTATRALHQALQHLPATSRTLTNARPPRKKKALAMQGLATTCQSLRESKRERMGIERGNVSTNPDKDLHRSLERGAAVGAAVESEGRSCQESDAATGREGADSLLEELARLWPKLSPEQQRQVLAFARRLVERATR